MDSVSYFSSRFGFSTRPFIIASVGLIVYFLPFIFSGADANIVIHDNLDNNFVRYKILNDEGQAFSLDPTENVAPMMGGLPRMYFTAGINLFAFLFFIMSPIGAYLVNFVIVHCVAFIGMYVLLTKHVLEKEQHGIAAFVALTFALLPFYVIFGFSVAGLPILAHAFINLLKGNRSRLNYLIIVLFAFHSLFMLVGIFVIAILGVWGIIDFRQKSKINRPYIAGVLLLLGTYLILNLHLVIQPFLGARVPSHRIEFVPEQIDLGQVVERSVLFFTELHPHVSSPLGFLIIPIVFAIILGIVREHKFVLPVLYLAVANVCISFIFNLPSWSGLKILTDAVPFLKQFQWNRFYFFSPFLWFIQLALALQILKDTIRTLDVFRLLAGGLALFVIVSIWKFNVELRETSANLFAETKSGWSFRAFYDERLFTKIKDYIGKPVNTYRVASLGIHPAVSLYNRMHTIDGYLPLYPLAYKHEFRKIIAGEIEKPNGLKDYFDDWGSRCYMFPTAFGYNFQVDKTFAGQLTDLRYDFSVGPKVDYILSAASIEYPERLGLKFLKVFEHPDSKWKIYLYELAKDVRQEKIIFSVKAKIKRDDYLTVYFASIDNPNFDESRTITKTITGRDGFQIINFALSDTLDLAKLRFDLGTNIDQDTIIISEMTFQRGDRISKIPSNAYQTNIFIERTGDRFRTMMKDGRYDPYGEFDDKAVELFNELRLKQK